MSGVNTNTVEPPNTAALETGKETAVLENGGKGSHITIRDLILVDVRFDHVTQTVHP